jgi:8-oxo-dGTP diphosphatase
VDPQDLKPLTFASHSYESFHLLMPLYECRRWRGAPRGAEGQALTWARGEEVAAFEMPAADIPLIQPVLDALAR